MPSRTVLVLLVAVLVTGGVARATEPVDVGPNTSNPLALGFLVAQHEYAKLSPVGRSSQELYSQLRDAKKVVGYVNLTLRTVAKLRAKGQWKAGLSYHVHAPPPLGPIASEARMIKFLSVMRTGALKSRLDLQRRLIEALHHDYPTASRAQMAELLQYGPPTKTTAHCWGWDAPKKTVVDCWNGSGALVRHEITPDAAGAGAQQDRAASRDESPPDDSASSSAEANGAADDSAASASGDATSTSSSDSDSSASDCKGAGERTSSAAECCSKQARLVPQPNTSYLATVCCAKGQNQFNSDCRDDL